MLIISSNTVHDTKHNFSFRMTLISTTVKNEAWVLYQSFKLGLIGKTNWSIVHHVSLTLVRLYRNQNPYFLTYRYSIVNDLAPKCMHNQPHLSCVPTLPENVLTTKRASCLSLWTPINCVSVFCSVWRLHSFQYLLENSCNNFRAVQCLHITPLSHTLNQKDSNFHQGGSQSHTHCIHYLWRWMQNSYNYPYPTLVKIPLFFVWSGE